MPRKQPIRTLAQINAANAKNNRKRAKTLARITVSSFVAELSARFFRRYVNKIKASLPNERKALFQSMPQYETVVARADRKVSPFRHRLEQKARAKKPRKYKAYAIGPKVSNGRHRLPLTLDAFIEVHARSISRSARKAWNELGPLLETIATHVKLHEDLKNPRADVYRFMVDGDAQSLKYGQFEKIFTASRKSRKANA